jgi:hypothetical protein
LKEKVEGEKLELRRKASFREQSAGEISKEHRKSKGVEEGGVMYSPDPWMTGTSTSRLLLQGVKEREERGGVEM